MVQRASERRSDACAIHPMGSDGLRLPPPCLQLRRRRLCSLRGRPQRERPSYRSWLSPLSSPCSASPEQSAKNSAGAGSSCHVFGRATGGCRPSGQAPVSGVCGTSPRFSSQACRSSWCHRYCFFFPWPSQESSWVWCSWRAATLCLPRWSVTCRSTSRWRSEVRTAPPLCSGGRCVPFTEQSLSRVRSGYDLKRLRSDDSAPLRGGCDNSRPPTGSYQGEIFARKVRPPSAAIRWHCRRSRPSKLKAQPTS